MLCFSEDPNEAGKYEFAIFPISTIVRLPLAVVCGLCVGAEEADDGNDAGFEIWQEMNDNRTKCQGIQEQRTR